MTPWQARIAERLKGTAPWPDPDGAARRRLPPGVAEQWLTKPLTPAAVLVPLLTRPDGLTVLLTRRAESLRDHPGQISFPGGRVEAQDADAIATALREAREELGIPPGEVDIAGCLPPHPVITGFAITPVVGFLAADIALWPDRTEVAEIFEVPVEFFLARDSLNVISRRVRGIEVPTYVYRYRQHEIWGATANILRTLVEIMM